MIKIRQELQISFFHEDLGVVGRITVKSDEQGMDLILSYCIMFSYPHSYSYHYYLVLLRPTFIDKAAHNSEL